jgi:hypothetical protein
MLDNTERHDADEDRASAGMETVLALAAAPDDVLDHVLDMIHLAERAGRAGVNPDASCDPQREH